MKVAVNDDYGGFGLSKAAVLLGREISNDPLWSGPQFVGEKFEDGRTLDRELSYYPWPDGAARHDPVLVEVIERLGTEAASGALACVCLAEVPDGMDYEVEEYDGREWVEPKGSRIYGEEIQPRGNVDVQPRKSESQGVLSAFMALPRWVLAAGATVGLPGFLWLMKEWAHAPWMHGPGLLSVVPLFLGVFAIMTVPGLWLSVYQLHKRGKAEGGEA